MLLLLNCKNSYLVCMSACMLNRCHVQLFVNSCMDCGPPGSSVHGVFQARILEWVAISSSRGSSWPRDQTHVSCISCIGRQILYHGATWEAHLFWYQTLTRCMFFKHFLPHCGFFSHFLDRGLWSAKVFKLNLDAALNVSYLRNNCQIQSHKGIPMFCSFISYVLAQDPLRVNFCMWCKVEVKFNLLHMGVQLSGHYLLKRLF